MATRVQTLKRSGVEVLAWDELTVFEVLKTNSSTADTLAVGDLIEMASGKASLYLSASADGFGGICLVDSPGDEIRTDPMVTVATRAKCRVKLASGQSALAGQALAWAAGPSKAQKDGGTQVDFTFTQTVTEGIAFALQTISSGGSGKVIFDVMALKAIDSDIDTFGTPTVA